MYVEWHTKRQVYKNELVEHVFSAVCVLFLNKIKVNLRFKPIASSLAHCAQT